MHSTLANIYETYPQNNQPNQAYIYPQKPNVKNRQNQIKIEKESRPNSRKRLPPTYSLTLLTGGRAKTIIKGITHDAKEKLITIEFDVFEELSFWARIVRKGGIVPLPLLLYLLYIRAPLTYERAAPLFIHHCNFSTVTERIKNQIKIEKSTKSLTAPKTISSPPSLLNIFKMVAEGGSAKMNNTKTSLPAGYCDCTEEKIKKRQDEVFRCKNCKTPHLIGCEEIPSEIEDVDDAMLYGPYICEMCEFIKREKARN